MSKMCQSCCLGQNTQANGDDGSRPLCKACEEMNSASSSSEENTLWSSSAEVNGSSPCTASVTSPPVSFSEYGSPILSYDGVQPYINLQMRNDEADGLDTGQHSPIPENAGYMEGHENGILFKDITVELPNANNLLNGLASPMSPEDNYSCKSLALNSCKGNTNENNELGSHAFTDGQRVGSGDDVTENVVNNDISPFLSNSENDPHIWTPPEPEDIEYDTDSVAYEDEDDGYNDGTPWSQPNLLSSNLDEVGNYQSYKEEREKAMMEAMNGQFKFLVSRLLASEGMGLSDGEGGKNWLDIATSLSWDAALLIKPGPNEGRAMDPGSYVKVKCIASGARTDSQVIKGLVFKKSTTHKHMPTKLKNPRILLLQGSLGRSANGFSSFGSMKEEEEYIKAVIDMIESCRPHVVLVEKTVPRDIQESLLDRGITVIFDMNISRLERIARCLGSQIISSAEILAGPKLKQCDTFRIEKFVEEHNCSGEGGKKSIKTLMFLEGCPRPLGCTILLKGAHIDELKKVKRVVQYTVFAAYHLILETSFFVDQRTFICDKNGVEELNDTSANKSVDSESCDGSSIMQYLKVNGRTTDAAQLHALEIPISDGSVEGLTIDEVKFNSDLDGGSSLVNASRSFVTSVGNETICSNQLHETHNTDEYIQCDSAGQALAPGQMLSSVSTSLRKFLGDNIPSLASDSISSCCGFNENLSRNRAHVSLQPEASDHGKEANGEIVQKKLDSGLIYGKNSLINPDRSEAIEQCNKRNINEIQIESTDDIEGTIDPQSILVLLSAYCIPKQTVCGQSHLSRIKYYGNFDISLGRYLQGILLHQKYSCPSCGEPPEHHIYCYTHRNGNLTVRVRSLPKESTLFGEAEGKIWMWTRCLKCQHEGGNTKPTKRVVMSSAARGLSFGKFLELSFSGHSAATRLSRCGHSLHRDCLRFFGLGSKVAMFKYSSVEVFTACKPSPVLEFAIPSEQEWYAREARDVLSKGDVFFMEVANLLEKLKIKCPPNAFLKRAIKSSGLVVEFDKVEEMLAQEKTDFEASLLKATVSYSHAVKNEDEIFGLNWHLQELLLLLYIWDRRLHSIFLCWGGDASNDVKQIEKENGAIYSNNFRGESMSKDGHEFLEIPIEVPFDAKESCAGESNGKDPYLNGSNEVQLETEAAETCEEKCSPDMKEDGSVLVLIGPAESAERATNLDTANVKFLSHGETDAHKSHKAEDFELEDPGKWIWSSFSELRKALRKDLNAGFLQKFRFINTYKPTHLSPLQQLTTLVADTLHFPVGTGGSVMSVVEDEISSIISCALALSEEGDGNVQMDNATDYSHFSTLNGSIPLAHSPNRGPLEPEKMKQSRSFSSISSDDLTAFGSDSTFFADGMIPSSVAIHPQIPLGSGKLSGKCKYSVVCVYAKQFYSLRKRCCSSELAYISSLSRCRKWDAQGGKSKVFFGKTMDDRFIIKQIKKAELESFLKFGPDYFKHITGSLDSGSQTCLAKILGVYQVRQYKSGKEIKTDVVVMENLFFGRNISRKYDLKGAVFSRYVSNPKDSESVLLDENFVEDMSVSPIYVGGRNKNLLQRAIWNDTSFLTSINVMDYSLLVGVDKQKHEIVFGIIDYLRQYTWDKQLETWVKVSLVVPKNELPTVISPKEYKKRFRKFMARYFLTVPDDWNSEQCSGTCKFCTNGSNGSSNLHNAIVRAGKCSVHE